MLQQRIKLLDGELGGFENMRECAPSYGSMRGKGNFRTPSVAIFFIAGSLKSLSI